MIGPDHLTRVTSHAVVPEQVVAYVSAVSGSRPRMVGPCVGYDCGGEFVLVAYPLHDPRDEGAMAEAVTLALEIPGLRRITVIGPVWPKPAPAGSRLEEDCYYAIPVPPPRPAQKLRNMLRRASRELTLEQGRRCGEDHMSLVQLYLDERPLAPGTRHIFGQLRSYLAASPGSLVLSARLGDGRLAAFVVGEFSSLHTAFFMFSFRDLRSAPPGSTDLLLSGLLDEAAHRGHRRMNLGLGINEGIRFFKGKWGPVNFLPYVQVTWEPRPPGLFTHLRGLFGR
jgi:hypothetical protein